MAHYETPPRQELWEVKWRPTSESFPPPDLKARPAAAVGEIAKPQGVSGVLYDVCGGGGGGGMLWRCVYIWGACCRVNFCMLKGGLDLKPTKL